MFMEMIDDFIETEIKTNSSKNVHNIIAALLKKGEEEEIVFNRYTLLIQSNSVTLFDDIYPEEDPLPLDRGNLISLLEATLTILR
jgi:hypothetical protein